MNSRIGKQQGFMLVTVLFLILVLGVIAIGITTTVSVQNYTTVFSLQQARAYAAARSGLDYGIHRAVTSGACTNGGIALPGVNFNVNVSCASVPGIDEAGNVITVYQLSATASNGTLGDVGYVTRTVRVLVN